MIKYHIVKTRDAFLEQLKDGSFRDTVVKGVDISSCCVEWQQVDVTNASFIGCHLQSLQEEMQLRTKGARVIPPFGDALPYDPFRSQLYSPNELMEGYDEDDNKNNCLDRRIERHFNEHGGHDPDIWEALSQALHDYSIDTAIKDLLGVNEGTGAPLRKTVGIMGGHLALRNQWDYRKTAELAAMLTREGYFIVSGGGPGIMEAANLGAYMAFLGDAALDDALKVLAECPDYVDLKSGINPGYLRQAKKVLEKYPHGAESLAIPTWFYGHEPVNLFAKYIGKYFSNSLREDGLLAISIYGVVYAPGSAATTQEVFADAAQNHYGTFDFYSPMVFLGASHYLQTQVYACLTQQAAGHPYAQMITISDEPVKLVNFIKTHPPIKV